MDQFSKFPMLSLPFSIGHNFIWHEKLVTVMQRLIKIKIAVKGLRNCYVKVILTGAELIKVTTF